MNVVEGMSRKDHIEHALNMRALLEEVSATPNEGLLDGLQSLEGIAVSGLDGCIQFRVASADILGSRLPMLLGIGHAPDTYDIRYENRHGYSEAKYFFQPHTSARSSTNHLDVMGSAFSSGYVLRNKNGDNSLHLRSSRVNVSEENEERTIKLYGLSDIHYSEGANHTSQTPFCHAIAEYANAIAHNMTNGGTLEDAKVFAARITTKALARYSTGAGFSYSELES